MCRSSDTRSYKKAMLLICEGTKTEPFFFAAFRNDNEKCRAGMEIIIQPKPALAQEDIVIQLDRGRRVGKKRLLKGEEGEKEQPMIFPGPQPLNWVNAGVKSLDTFEEVWCVFDKDDHPKRKEAFELAESQKQEGKNIHIAFSSRCIEYYFLLHFEYLYKSFEKSECNEKENGRKRSFHCGLPNAIPGKACQGERCTNGYARIKGYWLESKGEVSLYPLLRDRLLFGIRNAELLRRESSQREDSAIPFYDRNPYVTSDCLIARLLGYSILFIGRKTFSLKEESTTLEISKNGTIVVIKNAGVVSYAIREKLVQHIDYMTGKIIDSCAVKDILHPGDQCKLQLNGQLGDLYKINLRRQPCLFVL